MRCDCGCGLELHVGVQGAYLTVDLRATGVPDTVLGRIYLSSEHARMMGELLLASEARLRSAVV